MLVVKNLRIQRRFKIPAVHFLLIFKVCRCNQNEISAFYGLAMQKKPLLIVLSITVAAVFGATANASSSTPAPNGSELRLIGQYSTGSGIAGAEISAVDFKSKRLFITNGKTNAIEIVDFSNAKKPKLVKSVSFTDKGVTGIQSVAAKNGVVVVATSVGEATAAGKVFIMDVNGKLRSDVSDGVTVGVLPDSIHITPDGRFVVTADEAQPKNYCLTNGVLTETSDPKGSVSVIDLNSKNPVATIIDFSGFNDRKNAITYAGGRIFGPGATVAQDLEPEYVTISLDSSKAWVTLQENNAIATIDLVTKTVTGITGLGFKNHNVYNSGMDASDRDNKIEIVARNVQGMYLPDAVASLEAGGNTYLFTANEGDAREYPCLMGGTDPLKLEAEDLRFGAAADATVDSTFKTDAVVGRLKVTPFSPASVTGTAVTANTKVANAYSFGTRSFTVWKAPTLDGVFPAEIVFDSGDEIERVIAKERPKLFNADWNTTTGLVSSFESRSGSKGPEPEGLAIGSAYGRTWMVLVLERDSGLMLYDVTNPSKPIFRQYINTSTPGGDIILGTGGNVSPEGVLFLEASNSPTGKPMIVVSYELSGTVAMFELTSPGVSK